VGKEIGCKKGIASHLSKPPKLYPVGLLGDFKIEFYSVPALFSTTSGGVDIRSELVELNRVAFVGTC